MFILAKNCLKYLKATGAQTLKILEKYWKVNKKSFQGKYTELSSFCEFIARMIHND